MGLLDGGGPVLVLAPHPDDEVLGVGGTMARLAEAGAEVHVAIVTTGRAPAFRRSRPAPCGPRPMPRIMPWGSSKRISLTVPRRNWGKWPMPT